MKKLLLLLILLGPTSLIKGQPTQYISLAQLETALDKDWNYLHEILEQKKWILFNTETREQPNGNERTGYGYYYKKGNKSKQIALDNNYENNFRHIMLNIWDEDYYLYLKNQIKQRNYIVLGPNGYKNKTFRIFTRVTEIKSDEWGNTPVYTFSIEYNSKFEK